MCSELKKNMVSIFFFFLDHIFFVLLFYYHIIVVLGVHCDIYKSSYNISYLNSPLHYSLLSASFCLYEIFKYSKLSMLRKKNQDSGCL
jgi:hypothetical protein